MSNHEYCVDCGTNSFHHGRTCEQVNPEGRKFIMAEEELRKKLAPARQVAAAEFVEILMFFGVRSYVRSDGHVTILNTRLVDDYGEKTYDKLLKEMNK